MYELKKMGKVLTSKSVGTGPLSYGKRIYRAAVSQRLRNTALHDVSVVDIVSLSCYWLLLTQVALWYGIGSFETTRSDRWVETSALYPSARMHEIIQNLNWIVSIPLCIYTKFSIKSTVFTQHILLTNV